MLCRTPENILQEYNRRTDEITSVMTKTELSELIHAGHRLMQNKIAVKQNFINKLKLGVRLMSKEGNVNYPSYVNKAGIKSDDKGYGKDKYRFILSIPFDTGGENYLIVIMKNPSKADIDKCDNTVVKVCNAAYEAKYDGVVIMNLFPFRATEATEVFEYFYKQKNYNDTMKVNFDVIKNECADKVVAFAWGTNTICNSEKFKNEYDSVSEKIQNIVITDCATEVMAFGNNKKYPLHGLRWWKTIISESNKALKKVEICKPYIKIHHNMFGPSAESAGIDNPEDFEIFCYLEKKVCNPTKCNECSCFAGSEMGYGITCKWDDYNINNSADDYVVQHRDRYKELKRFEQMENYFESQSFSVEVYFGMSDEQAVKENKKVCIYPNLPNTREIYHKLDDIPEGLCVSKTIGWEKIICAKKENLNEILNILYEQLPDFNFKEIVDKIEGKMFWIYGYGD